LFIPYGEKSADIVTDTVSCTVDVAVSLIDKVPDTDLVTESLSSSSRTQEWFTPPFNHVPKPEFEIK
jgi:hypothetical protein